MSKLVEVTPEQVRKIVQYLGGTKDLSGDVEWCYSLVQGGIELTEAMDTVAKGQENKLAKVKPGSLAGFLLANKSNANVVTKTGQTERKPYNRKESPNAVDMICHCGVEYKTSESELAKGLGYNCSHRCAARRQANEDIPRGKRKPRKERIYEPEY